MTLADRDPGADGRFRLAATRGPIPERAKLGAETAERLRDAIISGHLTAGDRLRVEDIAAELGVSTMPVREALLTLEQEGLVSALPRRGFRVARLLAEDVSDIVAVQAHIASILASRAAVTIDESLIRTLRQIQEEIESASRSRLNRQQKALRVEALNNQFHREVNRIVDSPRLLWFLRITVRVVPRSFYATAAGWSELSLTEHPAILKALARHDSKLAGELMKRHVLNGGQVVVDAFNRRTAPDEASGSH